jgi:hypothetical protein
MNNNDLRVTTQIQTKTRLETLYYFIYEIAESFGVTSDDLICITKGVLEQRILAEIIINYKNSSNVVVGRITIKIDWEKHVLYTSSDYGAFFDIDMSKSVRSQIAAVSEVIEDHVKCMKKALGICRAECVYIYINEIASDPVRHQKAREYMGHVPSTEEKVMLQKEFKSSVEWLCGRLRELKIIIENS